MVDQQKLTRDEECDDAIFVFSKLLECLFGPKVSSLYSWFFVFSPHRLLHAVKCGFAVNSAFAVKHLAVLGQFNSALVCSPLEPSIESSPSLPNTLLDFILVCYCSPMLALPWFILLFSKRISLKPR